VILWISLEPDVKAPDIKIKIEEKMLEIRTSDATLLSKELKYMVAVPEEGVDWEVESKDGIRKLRVTLPKHVYIAGSVVWWSNVFVGDPEIDTSTLKGRKASTFSEAWQEANAAFQQAVANRELIDIDDP
jgi:hypothetical protein